MNKPNNSNSNLFSSNKHLLGTDNYVAPNNSPDILKKISDLHAYFEANGINYQKFNIDKNAYPNYDHYMHVPGQHNTNKWMQAVKDIYFKEKQGERRSEAIRQVTSQWKEGESYDSLNWLKFYEENTHLKYKFANWYESNQLGYYLPINPDSPQAEPTIDIQSAKDAAVSDLSDSHKKSLVLKQKKKIIGRLDSVEKLLRAEEGELFAGKELESLIESIYSLKKKIHLLNKISTSTRMYSDLIIREGNVLVKKGYLDAAEMLFVLADDKATPAPAAPAPPPSDTTATPATPAAPATAAPATAAPKASTDSAASSSSSAPADAPAAPAGGSAAPADIPPPADGGDIPPPADMPSPASPTAPTESVGGAAGGLPSSVPTQTGGNANEPAAISKFLERTQTSGITSVNDSNSSDDYLEVVDGEELFVEAQAAPAPTPAAEKETLEVNEEEPLEATENKTTMAEDGPARKQEIANPETEFDNKINDAFSNVKISDIITKLEDLSKIFKTREVPRQLSIVDMMLDTHWFSGILPALSEATNKALESNNYISTRVDDVLSKLRGALKAKDFDLRGDVVQAPISPQLESIKENLDSSEKKDKVKKQLKRQQEEENLGLESRETPEIEIEEELTPTAPAVPATPAPVPVAAPAPVPAVPATPTPAVAPTPTR